MKISTFFVALALAMGVGVIHSQEVVPTSAVQDYPYEVQAQMESRPGEMKLDFIKRVGAKLLDLAQSTDEESCAYVASRFVPSASDPTTGVQAFSVVITTNHSHLVCIERQESVLAGYTPSKETIHSHGYTSNFRVNANDVALTGGLFRINSHQGGRDQNSFSPQDMKAPGYLASRVGLLYQDGHGTVVNWGDYNTPTNSSSFAKLAKN